MRFQYVAYNLEQGVVRDYLEARSANDVTSELRQMGLKALSIEPRKGLPGLEVLFPSLFRAKASDLIRFARHLATMLGSGGSLIRALEMMQEESRSRIMRRTLQSIRKTLDEGGSLSAALREHPDVFNPLFISVVEVGELSGQLGESLQQLSDIIEREQEAKKKAIRTLMYPLAIVGMSIVTMSILMMVALPPMLKVFDEMGSEIPLITKLTVGAFTTARDRLPQMGLGFLGLVLTIKLLGKVPRATYYMGALQIKMPLVGGIIVSSEIARFSRTMAMLLGAGVPVVTALKLAISGCKNPVLKRAFQAAEESLMEGRGLSTALRKNPVLPSLFVEMAMIGEASNSLKRTMTDAAEAYQKQLEQRLDGLLATLEPVSTLVVGGIVALMAFSMLVPIYSGLNALK